MGLENFKTLRDLREAIHLSAQRDEKRDQVKDARTYLRISHVNGKVVSLQTEIPNKPTLIAPAHFVRPVITRFLATPGSIRERLETVLSTSRETMTTTTLITAKVPEVLPGRQIKWIVERDLDTRMGPFGLRDRQLQIDSIFTYNQIAVKAKFGMAEALVLNRGIASALRAGYNIGVYPEGRVRWQSSVFGWRMEQDHRSFAGVVKAAQRSGVQSQILPVGIGYHDGKFVLSFGDLISLEGNHRDIAQDTMKALKDLATSNS